MPTDYTPDQRSFAKALTLSRGKAAARSLLTVLASAPNSEWPEAPTVKLLGVWQNDPTLVPATEVAEAFARDLQLTVAAQMFTLLEPLRARTLKAIRDDDATAAEIEKLTKAYATLVDRVTPKEARAPAGPTFTGPTLIGGDGPTIQRLFSLKEIEEPAIDVA